MSVKDRASVSEPSKGANATVSVSERNVFIELYNVVNKQFNEVMLKYNKIDELKAKANGLSDEEVYRQGLEFMKEVEGVNATDENGREIIVLDKCYRYDDKWNLFLVRERNERMLPWNVVNGGGVVDELLRKVLF